MRPAVIFEIRRYMLSFEETILLVLSWNMMDGLVRELQNAEGSLCKELPIYPFLRLVSAGILIVSSTPTYHETTRLQCTLKLPK